ncbi:MAG TPA: hypothetical protein VGQ82_02425 [Chthoniobacterales bacterium]|nr:hypothetical protein [Chthoniobacterales bacterium]
MDSSGHLPVSESAARQIKTKGQPKGQPKGRTRSRRTTRPEANAEPHLAAPGTLSRTKALLLAALRVWELKQRTGQ